MTKETNNLFQVSNMASVAIAEAKEAKSFLKAHEDICAERYKHISEKMSNLFTLITNLQASQTNSSATLQASIGALSDASYEARGKWKGLSITSTILAIISICFAGVIFILKA